MFKKYLSLLTCITFLISQSVSAAKLNKPDSVTDYLCIGSQYTNKAYGNNPNGSVVSLGNFGGYITYYYADPLCDDPNDLYGIDFYIIGNSEEVNIDSLAEPGQVYVSEDGEQWYALAGSEHYNDTAIWDYSITYTKTEDGNSTWTDNYGNTMDHAAPAWPDPDIYTLNNIGNEDSYTFTGIVLSSQQGSITGDGTADTYAAKTKFGYADYYASNLRNGELIEMNPYVEAPTRSNGFDLAWAVNDDGTPLNINNKEFHYIKVATASNIHAGSFNEKSTEVMNIIRTTPQENEVGKTPLPDSITISTGEDNSTIDINENETVYNINSSADCSITVNSEAENIYINNERSDTAENFPKDIVRIITQTGNSEPSIIYLHFTPDAEPTETIAPEKTEEPTEGPAATETASPTPQAITPSKPTSSSNISVSFTLYGDEKHGDKETHTYKNNRSALPVWIKTKTYTIPADSTVLYLFEKALTEADISWTASGKNYISEINGLSEFDNGESSGWMYLINGDHATNGINDQILKNGDKIVFHYTDDYSAEQGSENFRSHSAKSTEQTQSVPSPTPTAHPNLDPTPSVAPAAAPLVYKDVESSSPYIEAIKHVTEKGLFNGISDTEFAPQSPMTRAMFTTVLYRLEGRPQVRGIDLPFTDTIPDEYYYDALKWAFSEEIINGVSDTEFAPDDMITNEHALLIIKRYFNTRSIEISISPWYNETTANNTLSRAKAADLFMQIYDKIQTDI